MSRYIKISIATLIALALALSFWQRAAVANIVVNAWQGWKLSSGLVLYYSFDGADMDLASSTAEALDRSGNGRNGNWKEHATSTAIGRMGQGVSLDGTNDHVDASSIPSMTNYTYSMWINVRSFTNGGGADGAGTYFVDRTTPNDPLASLKAVSGNFTHQRRCDDSSNLGGLEGGAIRTGEWQHVAWGRSGSTNFITVDGVKATESVGCGALTPDIPRIGIHQSLTAGMANAVIDEFRVYNRALSDAEVAQLYKQGSSLKQNVSHRDQLTSGITGYWTFDGPDIDLSLVTAEVRDRSGQGNHADWMNHASTTAAGKIGQGLSFDGSDDRVNTGKTTNTFISASLGTISVWMRPDGAPASQADSFMLPGAIMDDGAYAGITRGIDQNAGSLDRIWIYNWDGNKDNVGVPYTAGEWVHIVWMHTGGQLYAYKNGELVGSTASGDTTNVLNTVILGRNVYGGGTFSGAIDDIRIYNRALSADEVKQLYLMGASNKVNVSHRDQLTSGLVGYWTFDGQDMGPNVRDVSGQGNHGGLQNQTPTTTAVGKIGQGLRFDGSNDLVSAGTADTMLQENLPWSTSVWFNANTIGTDGNQVDRLVGKEVSGGSRVYIGLLNDATPNTLNFVVTGSVPMLARSAANSIRTGVWHHAVVVFDGSTTAANQRIYIDGIEVGHSVNTNGTTPTDNSTGTITLGNRVDGLRPLDGTLDDVRIYNRALSADEVKQLYLMGR